MSTTPLTVVLEEEPLRLLRRTAEQRGVSISDLISTFALALPALEHFSKVFPLHPPVVPEDPPQEAKVLPWNSRVVRCNGNLYWARYPNDATTFQGVGLRPADINAKDFVWDGRPEMTLLIAESEDVFPGLNAGAVLKQRRPSGKEALCCIVTGFSFESEKRNRPYGGRLKINMKYLDKEGGRPTGRILFSSFSGDWMLVPNEGKARAEIDPVQAVLDGFL